MIPVRIRTVYSAASPAERKFQMFAFGWPFCTVPAACVDLRWGVTFSVAAVGSLPGRRCRAVTGSFCRHPNSPADSGVSELRHRRRPGQASRQIQSRPPGHPTWRWFLSVRIPCARRQSVGVVSFLGSASAAARRYGDEDGLRGRRCSGEDAMTAALGGRSIRGFQQRQPVGRIHPVQRGGAGHLFAIEIRRIEIVFAGDSSG